MCADQLASVNSEGFSKEKVLEVRALASQWDLLKTFTKPETVQAQSKAQRKKIKSAAKRLLGRS